MGVTTKRGDEGTTEILFGQRVPKSDLRIEALGTLDEVNCALGLARSLSSIDATRETILAIQQRLLKLGSELACPKGKATKLEGRISEDDVAMLESTQAPLEESLQLPPVFVLPGANPGGASLDMARAVTRRFERVLIRVREADGYDNPAIQVYVNRLADLLFVLARQEDRRSE